MKKIVIIRSNQIQSDSRVEKYLSYLDENKIDYTILGWDRDATGVTREKTMYYRRKVGYVVGGMKAAINRVYWFGYVIKQLRNMKKKPEFIHACDMDCAFPAAVYKALFNRKAFLLFDVFDWMTGDGHAGGFSLMKQIMMWMEAFSLRMSNKVLICEEERKAQIPNIEKCDVDILPNIPMINNEEDIFVPNPDYRFDNGRPTLSYVGWFSPHRFLENILELASSGKFNLLIAGYGNKELVDKCNELNGKGNVKYFGRVKYFDGLRIQYNADIVLAMYCKTSPSHIYAAPNKNYEAMFLGKPLLTTKGIIIGNKTDKLNTGYVIEETNEDFLNMIESITREDIETKSKNARSLWLSEYQNYTRNFLVNKYAPLFDK